MPLHRMFGLLVFGFSLGAALMGLFYIAPGLYKPNRIKVRENLVHLIVSSLY
jgi:hypothetical protein